MRDAPAHGAARRVGRLHLRAAAEEDARRAATLLADALHTASLPGADGGQMLVVRRLALGRISPRASPATLALRIEGALREARLGAVLFDAPGAAGANAVLFPGRTEAIVTLARRHARGLDVGAWFWAKAVPAWDAGRARGERWLLLLEAAHTLPEAALVAASVVGEAVRAGVEDELLCAVAPGQGADWLQAAGWDAPRPAPGGGQETTVHPLAGRHTEILHRWRRRWGPATERLVWLATLMSVLDHPACAADPRLPARVAASLAATDEQADAGEPFFAEAGAPLASGLPLVAEPPLAETSREPERVEAYEQPPSSRDAAPWLDQRTRHAGLLFLVPVLQRLGFTEFLAVHPVLLDAGFANRLLWFIGERVGLTPTDPLTLALGAPDPWDGSVLSAWELPGPAREILAHPAPRTPLGVLCVAWLTAARRWCRRRARLGLHALICRPGRVTFSRTHLDLYFPLPAADLRVRRLALDIDPGWVPSLGRVVRFHYLEQHEFDD